MTLKQCLADVSHVVCVIFLRAGQPFVIPIGSEDEIFMSQLITKGLSRHPVYFNEQAFISRCWNILCNSNIHIQEFVIIHQTAERESERERESVCEREFVPS